MRNKNAKSEIKKEQLLSEQAFISYCNRDEASSHTTKLDIDQKFLKAAKKDGFIKPLLKSKELVEQKDGNEKCGQNDIAAVLPHQEILTQILSNERNQGPIHSLAKPTSLWNSTRFSIT